MHGGRRRGTVYLIVLISVVILVIIGISGLYAAQVQSRVVSAGADAEQARFNAQAAIELGATMIQENPNWRNAYGGGTWVNGRGLGAGTISVEVRDPDDADVQDSNLDSIVLRGVGEVAESRQMMEIRLDAAPSGVDSLESGAHAGRIMAFDGGRVVADEVLTSNGSTWASTATVDADVASAGTIFGATFNGSQSANGEAQQMPLASEVLATYQAKATPITMAEIAEVSSNRVLNGHLDFSIDAWDKVACTIATTTSLPHDGLQCMSITGRSDKTSGAVQDITSGLVYGQDYTVSAWVRLNSGSVAIHLEIYTVDNGGKVTAHKVPDVNVTTSWTLVSGTLTPYWDQGSGLSRAYLSITTHGGTDDLFVDDVSVVPTTLDAPVIERVVLSSSSNPYGSKSLNAEGMYVVDCADAPLIIRNCRIEGTLILLNAGDGTALEESVVVDTSANAPSLIIDGSVTIRVWDSDLVEQDQYQNFNPVGTAFGGSEDSDASDSYTSQIGGIVYVTTDVTVEDRTTFDGVLMADRDIIFKADPVTLTHRSIYAASPPDAFWGPERMVVDRRSWTKVVD